MAKLTLNWLILLFTFLLLGLAASAQTYQCGTTYRCSFCRLQGRDLLLTPPLQPTSVVPKKDEDFWTVQSTSFLSTTYVLNCGVPVNVPLDENIYIIAIGIFGALYIRKQYQKPAK